MSEPNIQVHRLHDVLYVTFDRPEKLNAMTWEMYARLESACREAEADDVRAMVLQSSSPRAFIAGTDITQFQSFDSGRDGVDYERKIDGVIDAILSVPVPTIAAVDGYCVGGGFLISAACDLRIATTSAQFGAPMARTLGNCLSQHSYRLIVELLGRSTAFDLLLRARLMTAAEAHQRGFVAELCAAGQISVVVESEAERLKNHSPLSMRAAKTSLNRLLFEPDRSNDDVLEQVYGSHDFREAVERFGARQDPKWSGR
ncbi:MULTISPECIES: enoyl-CoA hydratase/isomerase family protein [unclassified Nocardioides]|uniref:enoyl-CoA hydratase/isomerase family protein n=1 Tax=unclassified Nocardioides TaxID=2615069 RepID=UPI00005717C6|nr:MULTISPECIES: enoyl-CoA hydratase/isomerase family protein [unclassified Nocardioides]ABL81666.1 Enoyl-CoA hydratase/isomerase [Nocardioides sp. JS614]